jgi:hypothetical protein
MKEANNESFHGLEAFLLDDRDMTTDELRCDLVDLGINVDAFLANFTKVVSSGYRSQLRNAAARAAKVIRGTACSIFGDLRQKSYADLDALFRQIRDGFFGEQMQNAVIARCRNMQGSPSETELRSWLEDIAFASKQ